MKKGMKIVEEVISQLWISFWSSESLAQDLA